MTLEQLKAYSDRYWNPSTEDMGQDLPKQNLEDLLVNDPFYQAGITKLKNVKPFQSDPYFSTGIVAPNPEMNVDEAKLKGDVGGFMGYTLRGDPSIYVPKEDLDNPTKQTASTVTHEGIHTAFDPNLSDFGKGVIQGTISDSGSALGDSYMTEEVMTNYLSNLIHGEEEPFYPGDINDLGEVVNYATMMRPGQGPIGMKGIMDLLAKRGKPFLKKAALRAHKNIEARNIEARNKSHVPQHHGDISRGPGGVGDKGHQAPNIRTAKGFTTSSGMHGGKHYASGGRIGMATGMSPVEAQARGLGAQHHGSVTSGNLHAGNVGAGGGVGNVPGIGIVKAPPPEWRGSPEPKKSWFKKNIYDRTDHDFKARQNFLFNQGLYQGNLGVNWDYDDDNDFEDSRYNDKNWLTSPEGLDHLRDMGYTGGIGNANIGGGGGGGGQTYSTAGAGTGTGTGTTTGTTDDDYYKFAEWDKWLMPGETSTQAMMPGGYKPQILASRGGIIGAF